ncbi:MAG: discoidin domain-containing protein, partial [Bacteroidales bacterium]|nr:discoidin domain-containing protein [Bacteroidales bacterium]
DDGVLTPSFTLSFDAPRVFNRIMLQEYIPLGQRVTGFSAEALGTDGKWREIARETTIGYKRIVLIPETEATALRISITGALACPVLNRVALYLDRVSGVAPDEPLFPADSSCIGSSCDNGVAIVEDEVLEIGCATAEIIASSNAKVLDLGGLRTASGFFYAPAEKGKDGCVITYDLDVSADGNTWTSVFRDKMFDNIVNNPILQEVRFPAPVELRYIRMTPLRTSSPDTYSVSAFGILSE